MRAERSAGLFVLGAALLASGVALRAWMGSREAATRTYVVDCIAVAGVVDGTPVEVAGYPVGRVTDVRMVSTRPVRFEVDLAVREDVPMQADATAVVAPKGLAGGRVVNLDLGEDERPLDPASHLPGRASPSVEELVAGLDSAVRDLSAVAAELRRAAVSPTPGPGLSGTAHELNVLIGRLNRTADSAGALTDSLRGTAESSAAQVARAVGSVEHSAAAAERVASRMDAWTSDDGELARVLSSTEARLAELERATTAVSKYDPDNPEMKATLDALHTFSKELADFSTRLNDRPLQTLTNTGAGKPADKAAAPKK